MRKMKSFTLFCLCIATLTLTLIPGPVLEAKTNAAGTLPPPAAEDLVIWQVLPSQPLVSGKSFSLYTSPPAQYIVYGRRDYGINLVWSRTRPAVGNFTLESASRTNGPIRYAELVALKEKTGGYIYHKKREYGINLEFSRTPVYEWSIQGGNAGKPVVERNWGDSPSNISDIKFSLFNHSANCYVVYGDREYGINLVWKGGYKC